MWLTVAMEIVWLLCRSGQHSSSWNEFAHLCTQLHFFANYIQFKIYYFFLFHTRFSFAFPLFPLVYFTCFASVYDFFANMLHKHKGGVTC